MPFEQFCKTIKTQMRHDQIIEKSQSLKTVCTNLNFSLLRYTRVKILKSVLNQKKKKKKREDCKGCLYSPFNVLYAVKFQPIIYKVLLNLKFQLKKSCLKIYQP